MWKEAQRSPRDTQWLPPAFLAWSIFFSLCYPEAQDPSIHLCHELGAAFRVQPLPGGRRAPRNWGASHENIGIRGCLLSWAFPPLIFTPNPRPMDAVGASHALGKSCQVFPWWEPHSAFPKGSPDLHLLSSNPRINPAFPPPLAVLLEEAPLPRSLLCCEKVKLEDERLKGVLEKSRVCS